MSLRLALAGCAVAVMALTGCAGDPPASGAGTASPSEDPTATEAPCAQGARCYDFTDGTDGWPEANEAYFAGRDDYLDGSYRVVARDPGSWVLPAPLRASDVAEDLDVRIDTDATLGRQFPVDAAWGAACWTRDLDGGEVAGFGAHVQPGVLTVGLYDGIDGTFQPLRTRHVDGLSAPGKKTHLTLRCRQVGSTSAPAARIDAEVGGSTEVSLRYARTTQHFAWTPADGLGLLVAGQGADVFYDHVVVTPGSGARGSG